MKVSVLMAVYNGERYLQSALNSILSQTFTDVEFLIMNDGSTDSTMDILEENRKRDNRIILFSQRNAGLAASLNTLIKYARGSYIARMDADDVSLPLRLEKQVGYLDSYPEVGVVATAIYEIAPCGLPFSLRNMSDSHEKLVKQLLSGENPIAHGTVLIRKTVLGGLAGSVYRTRVAQDFDLWLRLAKITRFGALNSPLYELRRTSGCISVRAASIKSKTKHLMLSGCLDGESEVAKLNREIEVLLESKEKIAMTNAFDSYLNGKAFFRNGYYLSAINQFSSALISPLTRWKSAGFLLLTLMGKMGELIHSMINPSAYKR